MNVSDIVAFFSDNDAFFSDNDAFEPDVNLGPISMGFEVWLQRQVPADSFEDVHAKDKEEAWKMTNRADHEEWPALHVFYFMRIPYRWSKGSSAIQRNHMYCFSETLASGYSDRGPSATYSPGMGSL